jgi:hypothetical protein
MGKNWMERENDIILRDMAKQSEGEYVLYCTNSSWSDYVTKKVGG